MESVKTGYGRRSFLKVTTLAGGGMVLGFSWMASCKPSPKEILTMPKEWFKINGYLKIGENGVVTIMSPNPEIGQNVKTSMPMIVAEELDIDWKNVIVEQAPLDTSIFTRQLAGGSQSIRQGWQSLRMAGATARHILKEAAAKSWNVPIEEITTKLGVLQHIKTNKTASYGEMASAASSITIPKEVKLKEIKDFTIIKTSVKNVDGKKIVTGKPLFGIDHKAQGMLYAMIIHPPAFGLRIKSFDATKAKSMPGIKDIKQIKVFNDDYEAQWCDTTSFNDLVAIVGESTWQVMNAKKEVSCQWEQITPKKESLDVFGKTIERITPIGLENSESHMAQMKSNVKAQVLRKDGNPEVVFKNAATVIERSYSAPFLAHNTMEPMNFFAHVTADKAELVGPIQTPEFMEKTIAARFGLPLEKIDIKMSRMGGGFGRRLYGHFLVETAVISKEMNAPIKLVYSREDDMTTGIFRPAYHVTYKAALDENKNLVAFHVNAGGIPESPLAANRFPAGAIDHYLAEEWSLPSNISVGAFRAPRSNFIAGAEQAFLDEVAEAMGKDPIEMRIELLNKAKDKPVGKENDYDASRYAGVLTLLKDKSNWGKEVSGVHRGVAAYFCHNTYVAQVVDIEMIKGSPSVKKVTCAIDCGVVINPIAATNLAEGGIVDGIGHGMFSAMTFKNGICDHSNFNTYKLIRHNEAPREIEIHFAQNDEDPTGLGEPVNPPVIGALANALYRATGKRYYDQPFLGSNKILN